MSRNVDGASSDVEQLPELPSQALEFWRRARIVDATVREVAEHGYEQATVTSIAKRAGVSRGSFYDAFGSKEEALMWAYDAAVAYAMPQILRAFRTERDWQQATADALATYLAILDCDHDWALVCLRELPAAGERACAVRDAVRAPIMEALRERIVQESGDGVGVDTVLAGLDAMVVDRLSHRPGKPLWARRRELTSYALAPFAEERPAEVVESDAAAPGPPADRERIELLLDRGPDAQADFELLVQGAVARRDGPTLWHVSVGMAERRAAGEPVPEPIARQALEGLGEAWFFGLSVGTPTRASRRQEGS